MQVYRRMDIGTAKPTAAERAEIPHHLIDICEPTESFSAAAFAALAEKAISDTVQRGRLPVLCGGTGLYLDSVLSGVEFGELEPDPALRAELRRAEEEEGSPLSASNAGRGRSRGGACHPSQQRQARDPGA